MAHHAIAVAADIPVADIIAPEDEDIRLLGRSLGRHDLILSCEVESAVEIDRTVRVSSATRR
jgi:hypothetical protein